MNTFSDYEKVKNQSGGLFTKISTITFGEVNVTEEIHQSSVAILAFNKVEETLSFFEK